MNPIKSTTREHAGHTIRIDWFADDGSMGYPWDEHDGHGEVRCIRYRDYSQIPKEPGERVLYADRGQAWLYNFSRAIATAKSDGWDAEPYGQGTKGERAARAVEADFRYCQRWVTGDCYWIGYQVSVDGVETDSLWGIDSDSIDRFESEVFSNCIAEIDKETAGSFDYACRC